MKMRSITLDHAAATASSLCLVHCLILPALAVMLPVAGLISEMEWVHKVFVVLAVPLSVLAFLSPGPHTHRLILPTMAVIGCLLLLVGAFVEAMHDREVLLTVVGSVLLAGAHIIRIAMRRHAHG